MFSAVGQVGSPSQEPDLAFWARQLSEHCLFFSLGFEDVPFRTQAAALHKAWEQARPSITLPVALRLAAETRAYKTSALAALQERWLGWIFPTFVDHTRRELDLFVAHATGQVVSPTEDATSWLRFMAEHAAFAAHLMDPVEGQTIREALAFVGHFSQLQQACSKGVTDTLLAMSQNAGQGLDAFVAGPVSKARSVIHPVLAVHVLREGRRFLYTVDRLRRS